MGIDTDRELSGKAEELLRRAEERLRANNEKLSPPRTEEETQRLVHELQVHQVELEMQNKELQQARNDAETVLEKYSDLYDFAPVGYLTVDREGIILGANLTGASLLGVERSRLIGRRLGNFLTEENRVPFSHFLDKVFATEANESVETAILKEQDNRLFVQMEARICAGGECRIALIDISERKSLENQLLQAQKMEAIGTLAGGVAHDFNNILMAIIGFGSIAKDQMGPEDPK